MKKIENRDLNALDVVIENGNENMAMNKQTMSELKKSSATEAWGSVTDVDFLYAAQLVRDARDIRNLTFKKTVQHLKYQLRPESFTFQ